MIVEAAAIAGLILLARSLRRAGAASRAFSTALDEARRAADQQVEAIEAARAELADVQAQVAGLRWILRHAEDRDDGGPGQPVQPPPMPMPVSHDR